jgi:hypothetical protein
LKFVPFWAVGIAFGRLTGRVRIGLMADMNTTLPDSFYLVFVGKPDAVDPYDHKWQAWQRFSQNLADNKEQNTPFERLSESLFLFHSRSGVLKLNRFLEACKKETLEAKVFFLPQKPEPCE